MEFFRSFFSDLILILTEPKFFFRERYPHLRPAHALAFGVTSSWLAALLAWVTRVIKHETLLDGLHRIQEKLSTLPLWRELPQTLWQQEGAAGLPAAWKAEIFAVILTPFQSLAQFLLYGVLYYLGALILIPPPLRESGSDKVGAGPFIRLCAVSAAPGVVGAILGFLPFSLGALIGWIYGVAILMIGISVRYHVSSMRALAVILIPGFAGMITIGCVLGMLGVLFFWLAQALSGGI
ncbi:hypothetical protein EB061_00950 [bacterium]|jgi:hypothetical protein|nr:hypothetical protein [bacterium]